MKSKLKGMYVCKKWQITRLRAHLPLFFCNFIIKISKKSNDLGVMTMLKNFYRFNRCFDIVYTQYFSSTL